MSSYRRVARLLALLLMVAAVSPAFSPPARAGVTAPDDRRIDRRVDRPSLGAFLTQALAVRPDTGPSRTLLYQVGRKGAVTSGVRQFRQIVADTLHDPRGWSLRREVLYVPVRRRGDLRIWLASPQAIAAAHPECSARYSCRVEDDVYINDVRWRSGSDTFGDRSLMDYRQYVVNHEVGHWLGLDHRTCRAAGSPAWVMQQQTITLGGCDPRVWPLPAEQRAVKRATALD